jgi:hypothetical protein
MVRMIGIVGSKSRFFRSSVVWDSDEEWFPEEVSPLLRTPLS